MKKQEQQEDEGVGGFILGFLIFVILIAAIAYTLGHSAGYVVGQQDETTQVDASTTASQIESETLKQFQDATSVCRKHGLPWGVPGVVDIRGDAEYSGSYALCGYKVSTTSEGV